MKIAALAALAALLSGCAGNSSVFFHVEIGRTTSPMNAEAPSPTPPAEEDRVTDEGAIYPAI